MLRPQTSLPPRPKIESTLLDEMLRLTQRLPPMSSSDIAKVVCDNARLPQRPLAFDVRRMLRPPYFKLQNDGWVCRWNGLGLVHVHCRVCGKLLGYRLPLRRIPLGNTITNIKVSRKKVRR